MVRKMENQTKIICPTCKGNGFYRVPYHLAKEEMHAQCTDCDSEGEIVIDDNYTPEDLRVKGVI